MSTTTPLPELTGTRAVVAAEVRALLGRHNKTQGDIAILFGITQTQVSRRMRGIIPFDSDELVLLANYFGVSVGSLFGENTAAPHPGGPDGGLSSVRHQGLEPRTRWYGAKRADLHVLADIAA